MVQSNPPPARSGEEIQKQWNIGPDLYQDTTLSAIKGDAVNLWYKAAQTKSNNAYITNFAKCCMKDRTAS